MSIHMEERVRQLFGHSIELKIALADELSVLIAKAGERLVNCLLNDGKILICGNGGSAANCQQFSSSMLNHFEVDRPSLPVINLCADVTALTSMISEHQYAQAFGKQIQALGQAKDILLILAVTGNAESILGAVQAAHDKGMDIIALSGRDGGLLANHLKAEDMELRIQTDSRARIREMHLFILHSFSDLIDQAIFGQLSG